jgi:hypothetical protein
VLPHPEPATTHETIQRYKKRSVTSAVACQRRHNSSDDTCAHYGSILRVLPHLAPATTYEATHLEPYTLRGTQAALHKYSGGLWHSSSANNVNLICFPAPTRETYCISVHKCMLYCARRLMRSLRPHMKTRQKAIAFQTSRVRWYSKHRTFCVTSVSRLCFGTKTGLSRATSSSCTYKST